MSLLTEACNKARNKGERLASAAGVKIKNVYAVSDQDFGALEQWFGYSSAGMLPVSDGTGGKREPSIFVPKEIKFKIEASMLFRLEE